MEIKPAAMSMIIMGIKKGLTRLGPCCKRMACCFSKVPMPPIPLPTTTPAFSRSKESEPNLASSKACCAQTNAYCSPKSMRRASFLSMYREGSKFLTSAAIFVEKSETSNLVTLPMPETPSFRLLHNSATEFPTGEVTPMPVTTTRLFI